MLCRNNTASGAKEHTRLRPFLRLHSVANTVSHSIVQAIFLAIFQVRASPCLRPSGRGTELTGSILRVIGVLPPHVLSMLLRIRPGHSLAAEPGTELATKKGRRDPSSGNYDERNDECLCSLDVNWDQVSFYARREGVPSHHYTVLAPPPPLARSSPLAPAGPRRIATAAPLPAC